MEQTEQVEVKLLHYNFRFKRLRWREEFAIVIPSKVNPQRVLLSYALLEVSGLTPKNTEESLKVMNAVPIAIIERVFRIWKGSFPAARHFTSSRLYKAPEPVIYSKQLEQREDIEATEHDRMMAQAESKFGPEQLAEARELEKKILEAAKVREGGYRGAIPTSEDRGKP